MWRLGGSIRERPSGTQTFEHLLALLRTLSAVSYTTGLIQQTKCVAGLRSHKNICLEMASDPKRPPIQLARQPFQDLVRPNFRVFQALETIRVRFSDRVRHSLLIREAIEIPVISRRSDNSDRAPTAIVNTQRQATLRQSDHNNIIQILQREQSRQTKSSGGNNFATRTLQRE